MLRFRWGDNTTLHTVEETFCDGEVLNPGNSDTLELLIAVMMATEGCVTLNRWERERGSERRGCVRKCFGFLHISLEKWPGETG